MNPFTRWYRDTLRDVLDPQVWPLFIAASVLAAFVWEYLT